MHDQLAVREIFQQQQLIVVLPEFTQHLRSRYRPVVDETEFGFAAAINFELMSLSPVEVKFEIGAACTYRLQRFQELSARNLGRFEHSAHEHDSPCSRTRM